MAVVNFPVTTLVAQRFTLYKVSYLILPHIINITLHYSTLYYKIIYFYIKVHAQWDNVYACRRRFKNRTKSESLSRKLAKRKQHCANLKLLQWTKLRFFFSKATRHLSHGRYSFSIHAFFFYVNRNVFAI